MTARRVLFVATLGAALAAFACSDAAASSAGEHAPTAPTAAAHEQGDQGPLEFKKDLALWTAIIFLILLAVLWKFAWGPIMDGLAKREKGIADQISQAEANNAEARRLLMEYEDKLHAAGDEVRKMLHHARDEADKNARAIVDAARDDAKAEHQRALAEIENATAGALKELAERSADLAVGLAGRIVRAELRPEAHADLVRQAVADFAGAKKPNGRG